MAYLRQRSRSGYRPLAADQSAAHRLGIAHLAKPFIRSIEHLSSRLLGRTSLGALTGLSDRLQRYGLEADALAWGAPRERD